MSQGHRFFRALFFVFLLVCLLTGLVGVVGVPVQAAPQMQGATNIVISEFRSRGVTASDEFIELFNPTSSSIPIGNWTLRKSSGCGITTTLLEAIPADITLAPGQYYLISSLSYTGPIAPDVRDTADWDISDTGGVALLTGTTIVDQVGLCDSTLYLEENHLDSITSDGDQSYERNDGISAGSCLDYGDNAVDFRLISPSNPQNASSQPIPCLVVTGVTSPSANGTYVAGNIIDIEVSFSSVVDVTGAPTLLLETGVTDRQAVYLSGTGTDTLTFRYTAIAGDSSSDLNYVAIDALALNGGTIIGASGNAVLTLPAITASNSLGGSKNIIIDNGIDPAIVSISRYTPVSTPTNSTSLIFRVTFNEPVLNVDGSDFLVTGTTGTPSASMVSSNVYNVTVSGGDLAVFTGVVGLNVNPAQNITDTNSNALPDAEPIVDETYAVDHIQPTIVIDQGPGQVDPANTTPLIFTITFSETIDTSTFTASDISETGTASFISWTIASTANPLVFQLSAISIAGNGFVTPVINAGQVRDLSGNSNFISTSTSPALGTVDFNDTIQPTVTINQSSGQPDPASAFPINFTVVFSEPIIASIFTTSDITQSGSAAGVTWSITNSGDNKTFTVSATNATSGGTIRPTIQANRVTDVVGNTNLVSTSTDNTVQYNPIPTITPSPTRTPTRTRTPTPVRTATRTFTPPPPAPPPPLVAINEFVPRPGHDWNNDGFINTGDEYIELINHGVVDVNLSGYKLDDEANIGSSPFSLPSEVLKPGQRRVFYGSLTGLLLSDGGDGVRLLKPNGQLMDAYNYSVVDFPDQSFCRLPDNGGLDDWNTNCYPTAGLPNTLSGVTLRPPTLNTEDETVCPVADTLPEEFVLAECYPFGNNIWNQFYWDQFGWYGERVLPNIDSKWDVIVD